MTTQITDLPQAQTPLSTGDVILVIQEGIAKQTAQANLINTSIQSDWDQTNSGVQSYIKNKPTLGTSAAKDAGTAAGDVLLISVSGTLPVLDGSNLTNVNATSIDGTPIIGITGSGDLVLNTNASLTAPALGTPSAVVLSNAIGLPLTTGVTGTLGISHGGTGQTTANTALNALLPDQASHSGAVLTSDGSNTSWAAISGTVSSVGVTGANGIGVSGSPITSSGTIALSLGNITPTTVNALTLASQAVGFTIAGGTTSKTLTVPNTASVAGTNTGDQTTSGTANRISVTNGSTNPTINIDAAYVGQASITTLGTIGTGLWQGTKIGVMFGGTNADLSATGGSSQVLQQATAGAAITVGQLAASDLSNSTTGSGQVVLKNSPVLSTPLLGTPTSGVLTNCSGYDAGSLAGATLAAGVTASSLTSLGTIATGVWHGTVVGSLYGGTGLNTSASSGVAQVSSGTWSISSALPSGTTATTQSAADNSTKVATTAYVDGAVSTGDAFNKITSGTNTVGAMVVGTGASLATSGSGTIAATSAPASGLTGATLAAGVTASSLTSLGTIATGVWQGTVVAVDHGGTGQTSYTDGQILIGNTATGGLTKATITAGSNITVTNGNGTITIAASGSVSTSFDNITGATNTTAAMVVGTGSSLATSGSGTIAATSAPASGITGTTLASGVTASSLTSFGSNPVVGTQASSDNSTRAASTAYVTTAVTNALNGLDWKPAVGYATTANVVGTNTAGVFTYTSLGIDTIDGHQLALNDVILFKNQTTGADNGVWVVTTAGAVGVAGVLTRRTDYNTASEIHDGDTFFVQNGTTNAGTSWTQTAVVTTINTDALTFSQSAGPGTFVAGNGLTLTGNSFSIDTSITVDKTTAQTLTNKTLTSPIFTAPVLGTPASGNLANCTFPTLNQNTTGSAASLSVSGQTGLLTVTGLTSTNRAKTVRDAADTILELGGSYTPTGTWTSLTMATPVLGTPTSGNLANCTFPTLNQNTSGSAASLSISGQTGLMTVAGLASTNRIKTVRDAADTILELGGSYTPTGTWTSLTMVTPVLGTPTSGTLTNCTGYTDANLSTSDVTTNNASTSKHGFLKKLDNTATHYMDGTGAWSTPAGTVGINPQSTTYAPVGGDNGYLVEFTGSSDATWTLTSAVTLGANWACRIWNNGTSNAKITLKSSSGTIDGIAAATGYFMYPNEIRDVWCDGTNFLTNVVQPFFMTLTSGITFQLPASYAGVTAHMWGAGGSGAGRTTTGNAGGGGGGAYKTGYIPAAVIGAVNTSVTVSIGAGGNSVSSSANGNDGGNTTFGSLMTAYGGAKGLTGSSVATAYGGGGGGWQSAGTTTQIQGSGTIEQFLFGQGAPMEGFWMKQGAASETDTSHLQYITPYAMQQQTGITAIAGQTSIYGGGTGGGATSVAIGSTTSGLLPSKIGGEDSYFGGGGGGAGGSTGAQPTGGNSVYGSGGGGGCASTAGGTRTAGTSTFGGAGGAGGANTGGNATAGVVPGGGGGGACQAGTSGAGGNGQVILIGVV